MKHNIPVEALGTYGAEMANAIGACVHCGFCLATCPTYKLLGQEMDSPRGRILLMKGILEGELSLEPALPFIDRCLGCQACVTACPSGVPYGELVMLFRSYAEERRSRTLASRAARRLALSSLSSPARFRGAAALGNLAKPLQRLAPDSFQPMLDLLPSSLPAEDPLPSHIPATGLRRARVVFLAGCVQRALDPEINWAALRVLAHNGVEILIPRGQGCCGSLAMHAGDLATARQQARRNLRHFPTDVDAILTNAAGCGSGMKEYELLFQGEPEAEQARAFARRVRDISEFLGELGLVPPPALKTPLTLVYQDACHLAHAQGITIAPRRLLEQIGELTLVPLAESDLCCGSAGMYNIDQPEIASQLGERKVRHILSSGAQGVVSGNIGCMNQIRMHLARTHQALPVYHTLQVLDLAYHGHPKHSG